jgi:hypothetical protein
MDEVIEVTAYILDPLHKDTIKENIKVFKDDYESADDNGVLYLVRAYKNGVMEQFAVTKEVWNATKEAFASSDKQIHSEVDKLRKTWTNG